MEIVNVRLTPWVADKSKPTDTATKVLQVIGDFRVRDDLMSWHPRPELGSSFFRHVRSEDDQYAVLDSIEGDWEPNMQEVLMSLKLRPRRIHGVEALADLEVPPHEPMDGWLVKKWVVVKALGPGLEQVHQDLITWNKDAFTVMTSMLWRVYKSLEVE